MFVVGSFVPGIQLGCIALILALLIRLACWCAFCIVPCLVRYTTSTTLAHGILTTVNCPSHPSFPPIALAYLSSSKTIL